jgi:hypothetical protein
VESVLGQPRLTVEFITRPSCQTYALQASDDSTNWSGLNHLEVAPPVPLPGGLERRKWADQESFGDSPRRLLRVWIGM